MTAKLLKRKNLNEIVVQYKAPSNLRHNPFPIREVKAKPSQKIIGKNKQGPILEREICYLKFFYN